MTRVRTVRVHINAYGDKPEKGEGDPYDHPDPAQLIADGLVEAVDPLDHDENGKKGGSKPKARPAEPPVE